MPGRLHKHPEFTIYVDGSSRGNPGPAGIGIAIFKEKEEKEPFEKISKFIGYTTNNVAEYEAVIQALKWLINEHIQDALIVLDSELVYKQITNQYRARTPHIQKLLNRLNLMKTRVKHIRFKLVSRKQNRWANRLAQRASKIMMQKLKSKNHT